MTTLAWPQEATLEAQQRICLECGEERGAWLVQRAAQAQDLWHLAHAAEGGSYTIAAAEPV